MAAIDTQFAGSIPGLYDRYLGPLLFEPYARDMSRRVAAFEPAHVLEIAAGTGILTEQLDLDLVNASIVATDLNRTMIDVAAAKIRSKDVAFQQADALDLPFEDCSFDVVVCQFGVMFFPDKVKGNAEARRVLRKGGAYIIALWDRLEANPASQVVNDTLASLYPDNPPSFLARTPFGYADPQQIERDLRAAGFDDVSIETVEVQGKPLSARDAVMGLIAGCPLAAEVEQRDPAGLKTALDATAEALAPLEADGTLAHLSAHIATAIK